MANSSASKNVNTAIRVSAPGRVGLIGGYSILEKGNVSYSFTVDARVHCEITPAGIDGKIRIRAPQFGLDTFASWKKNTDASTKETPKKDQQKITSPKPTTGQLILENDVPAAVFAKAAAQTVLEYFEYRKMKMRPFTLETRSDSAFTQGGGKSGLGSSAAATVAMVHALLLHHGVNDSKITHHCAQVAHSKAQGKVGSGYDVAASVFGSQEYERYSPERVDGFPKSAEKPWDYFIRPLEVPGFFHLALATFPQESTSTVSMTRLTGAWKKAHPKPYAELMHDLNDANVDAIAYLEQLHTEKTEENLGLFKDFFESGRALTRQLGEQSGAPIEPADVRELIYQSLQNGAFVCKSPGAGGKDNLVALCLTEKDAEKVKAFWKRKGLEPLDVKIQNQGVRVENDDTLLSKEKK
ncbi:hypothetical protein HYV43_05990 [Candidatus Micrarchaeota archaeon]|nr:hypothetical protein [Candidatus Micrarchaeota archaeon]